MFSDRHTALENAKAAHEAGRYEEAAAICEQLLQAEPADIEAKTLGGRIAISQGRFPDAISVLDAVLRANPESRDALIGLSISFRKSGSLKAASGVAMRAAQLYPSDPDVLNNLGLCQKELKMLGEAASSFRRASGIRPGSAEYAENLGTALYMQGLHAESAEAFRLAIENEGRSAEAYVGLGRALLAQDQFEEAVLCAAKAIEIGPQLCSAQILKAQLLIKQGYSREARKHAEKAIRLEPGSPLPHAVLGLALQSMGLIEESNQCFLKSIELDPRQGYSYFALVYGKRASEADRKLEAQMLALLRDPSLPQTDIQSLQYALGRVNEGYEEFEKAMRHYDEANRIGRFVKFRGQTFDRLHHTATRDRVKSFFTKERFDGLRGAGSESDAPIFIVGMMRSGTTLMEQILSCHPDVGPAGEQSFWSDKGPTSFDPATGTLDSTRIAALAAEYLALLRRLAPNAGRITDKMPMNTLALGFIHAALPNARIVHMNRNAADTCFSIYATPNDARFDFAHDKEAIAFAYRTQLDLMEHWRRVLPSDRFLDVAYEDLIENPEPVARRVLEFCGLEWSDLCLAPERNERSVATPSAWQVRQPVYKTSVQRWRNFEPWIREFAELVA